MGAGIGSPILDILGLSLHNPYTQCIVRGQGIFKCKMRLKRLENVKKRLICDSV